MAKIIYEVYQVKGESSKMRGKWYGRAKSVETLNTRKLAQHIAEHGSIYTPDVVYGVLEKFRSCLLEMLLNSRKVKIDGLGTFYCTMQCKPGGALKEEDFKANQNVEALHIRFLPEQEAENNISSREFLKKAEFINIKELVKGIESSTSTPSNGSGTEGGGSGNENQGGGSGTGDNGGSQSEPLAAPTISGKTSFSDSTTVSLSGPDGADIYYTLDGSTPTSESTMYTEEFGLSETTTVKAIAIKDGQSSEVVSKIFTKG